MNMPEVFVSQKEKKLKKTTKSHKKSHLKKVHEQKGSPLSAFSKYPKKVHFIGADKEEKIILLLRRHPITNVGWILIAFLMILAPLVLTFFPVFNLLPVRYQLVTIMTWYLLTTAFVFEEFLSWFFNVYIVTDERIFDVDFVNLVYREITDANIDQIQDVTVRVGSVVRTLFGYGDIIIQTASEIPQIEFDAVPRPDEVARVLRELRVEEEVEKLEGRVR